MDEMPNWLKGLLASGFGIGVGYTYYKLKGELPSKHPLVRPYNYVDMVVMGIFDAFKWVWGFWLEYWPIIFLTAVICVCFYLIKTNCFDVLVKQIRSFENSRFSKMYQLQKDYNSYLEQIRIVIQEFKKQMEEMRKEIEALKMPVAAVEEKTIQNFVR